MAIIGYFLPSAPGAERRDKARRKLSLLARGSHHDGTGIDVRIHNISGTGLLFESDIKLAAGDRIEIELPHAGDIMAVVIWASGRHFGCQFEGPVSSATLSAVELKSATDTAPGVADAGAGANKDEGVAEAFGDRLQRLRIDAGLDRAAVAERMDVGETTVLNWEKGDARPDRDSLAMLAATLGVQTSDLVDDDVPDRVQELIDRGREQIARSIGISVDKIRIIIEF